MTEKDKCETIKRRTKEFQMATNENRNTFIVIAVFLTAVVAVIAWTAVLYGDAYWAKTLFPHKALYTAGKIIFLTMLSIPLAIIAVISSYTYSKITKSISSETNNMHRDYVLEGVDFRHDNFAKLDTFVQYLIKESSGLFAVLATGGVIASWIAVLFASFSDNSIIVKAPSSLWFTAVHSIILTAVVMTTFYMETEAGDIIIELTKLNFKGNPKLDYVGDPRYQDFFYTTFVDRLALLQMPPKEVKPNGTKDNA